MIIGIDDAGRGPLIGPMVLAGVLLSTEQEQFLKKKGVADSKTLSHPRRIALAAIIKETVIASAAQLSQPEEIDHAVLGGANLNTLEAQKAAHIINTLNTKKEPIKVIIDCPSTNLSAWRATVLKYVDHAENLTLICEHKADANHPSVSAASILAKVVREEEVAKLKETYGNFGSGYPSDPTTKAFLKSQGALLKDTGIFRKSWETWRTLFPVTGQKTL